MVEETKHGSALGSLTNHEIIISVSLTFERLNDMQLVREMVQRLRATIDKNKCVACSCEPYEYCALMRREYDK